jgi:hypothetical protein
VELDVVIAQQPNNIVRVKTRDVAWRRGAVIGVVFAGLLCTLLAPSAEAAIAFVQDARATATATSIMAVFPSPPTEGNLLVAIAANASSATSPPVPGGWTEAIANPTSPGQIIYYRIAQPGETSSLVVGPYPSTNELGLHIYEWSGIHRTTPVDVVGQANGSGSPLSSGTAMTTADDALLMVGMNGLSAEDFGSWTNSFTELNDFDASGNGYAGAYRIVSGAGMYATEASRTGNTAWRGQIVAFRGAPEVPTARPDPEGGVGVDRYAAAIVALSPLSYWRLGETAGATASDEMGVNDGTYVGPILGAAGAMAGDPDLSADFDGTNDYVNTGTFDVAGTGVALTAWINLDTATINDGRIITKALGTAESDHLWMLSTFDDGTALRLRSRVQAGGTTTTLIATTGEVELGRWHHAAMTYDGSMMVLYLDGVVVGSRQHDVEGPVDSAPTAEVWIGDSPATAGVKPIDGRIDDVAVFERALTVDEIQVLYAAGKQYYHVAQGATLVTTASDGVLANDSDPQRDPLTVRLFTAPAHAFFFQLNGDGSFEYAPDPTYLGTDTFVYEVCDGTANCATATVTLTVTAGTSYTIAGTIFEDANFSGVAGPYDGGAIDVSLGGVDIELYDALDSYRASVTTTGDGGFSFAGLPDGNYKVRVRTATIGDADTPPDGGFNAAVPGTWPYPLPEMTWGHGTALIGGQDSDGDDTATADNAGPGDCYVPVAVSGADVNGVEFGFSYEVIVNEIDDANADNVRSQQGSLRQFIKNSNAIAGVNKSWFQNPGN